MQYISFGYYCKNMCLLVPMNDMECHLVQSLGFFKCIKLVTNHLLFEMQHIVGPYVITLALVNTIELHLRLTPPCFSLSPKIEKSAEISPFSPVSKYLTCWAFYCRRCWWQRDLGQTYWYWCRCLPWPKWSKLWQWWGNNYRSSPIYSCHLFFHSGTNNWV